jgi:hypothetical protein
MLGWFKKKAPPEENWWGRTSWPKAKEHLRGIHEVRASHAQLARAMVNTLASEDGHLVMCYLAQMFHVLNSHRGDAYSEGQRSVVLHLLKCLNVDAAVFAGLVFNLENSRETEL